MVGLSGSPPGKAGQHVPVGAGRERGKWELREGGIDGGGWRKETEMEASDAEMDPPQLQVEKLNSALFKWLPPLQTWLINIGLPSISHSVEPHWHFRTKAAPVLSMKMPRVEASSPGETVLTHRGFNTAESQALAR